MEEPCYSNKFPCHPCGYRQALRAILLTMDDLEGRYEGRHHELWEELKETIEGNIKTLLPGR